MSAPSGSIFSATPASTTSPIAISAWDEVTRFDASCLCTFGFPDQIVCRFGEDLILRLAIDELAPDLEHDRHGERRHAVEIAVDDSPGDSRKHVREARDVQEAGRRILTRRFEQEMIGLVPAQHRSEERRVGE